MEEKDMSSSIGDTTEIGERQNYDAALVGDDGACAFAGIWEAPV
jgi:hypothetical protein